MQNQKRPLREYRIRLDPGDVRRLREMALAESREGQIVYWTDYVRESIAKQAGVQRAN